jgi:hypothetical protein
MSNAKFATKSELLDQYKRELMALKLSLTIIGENSGRKRELILNQIYLVEKMMQLEKA